MNTVNNIDIFYKCKNLFRFHFVEIVYFHRKMLKFLLERVFTSKNQQLMARGGGVTMANNVRYNRLHPALRQHGQYMQYLHTGIGMRSIY